MIISVPASGTRYFYFSVIFLTIILIPVVFITSILTGVASSLIGNIQVAFNENMSHLEIFADTKYT